MNYIIKSTDDSIQLNIEKQFAKPYFLLLHNIMQQPNVINFDDPDMNRRAKLFIDKVALDLGLIVEEQV